MLIVGDKEMKQCELIFQLCGSPDDAMWPESRSLPNYDSLVPMISYPRTIRSYIKKYNSDIDEITLDLLDKFLQLNPDKRIKANEALEHEYFKCEPLPSRELSGYSLR